ncbi:aquaporin [Actinotalea sp. M2MS4P-6]|uniref:MIP/aquaporin family protein n=1 Tax=Actinotalea sp. M2MS4P-6 TaxID=2983762 RepID=UPI0021E4E65E|nr:aquaporin [Actinotalea sp. M2MS4P-6]MCV2395454.1 aquaporin [Actinotalea sp. M2MS4P-6]
MSTEPNPSTPGAEPEPTAATPPPPEPEPTAVTPPATEPVAAEPVAAEPTGTATGPVGEIGLVEEVDVVELVEERPLEGYGLMTRLAAEMAGTFALVLVVVATQVFNPVTGLGTLGIALSGGLVLAGLYAAFVHVSGGHFNPALSIASAIAGRTRTADAAFYVVAQVLAAVVAVAVVWVMVPDGLSEGVGLTDRAALVATAANGYAEGSPLSTLSSGQVTFGLVAALLVETIGAAVLAGVLLGTRPSARSAVPLGLTYAAVLLIALPITGGGLNPARSTGVAVFMAGSDHPALTHLWLFWVAPLVGAAIAGLAKLAFGRREQEVWVTES